MTEKRKVLGRGLESLLPRRPFSNVPSQLLASYERDGEGCWARTHPRRRWTAATTALHGETVQELALAQLDPNPYQTRARMR